MELNRLAFIAGEAGRIMLESGAETYRVEETIVRICHAYNIRFADSFVTPTGIMFTLVDYENNNISIIRRIKKRTIDIDKICRINDLSRNLKTLNYDEEMFLSKLKEIDNTKRYNSATTLFCASIGAGFFASILGGSPKDFICAAFIGLCIKFVTEKLLENNLNGFFTNIIGGVITGIIALIMNRYSLLNNLDTVIVGAIMLLVPGLAVTNAIRDTIGGDVVSGLSRGLEAIFVAISIAIGVGFVLNSWIHIFGGLI